MDIFFSGSIRGGRADVDLYGDLVEFLQQHGTVLSEHIGTRASKRNRRKRGCLTATFTIRTSPGSGRPTSSWPR